MSRIKLTILWIIVITGILSTAAMADTLGPFEYMRIGMTASITGYFGSGGDVSIPLSIDVYSVTSIGDGAFARCSSLTSVTIPRDGVTSIGNGAFAHCSSLTSVTIPDAVTFIGSSAFYNCSSLPSITIPDAVTSIGDRAFDSCSNLTSVLFYGDTPTIGSSVFLNSSPTVYYRSGTTGWSSSFAGRPTDEAIFNVLFYAGTHGTLKATTKLQYIFRNDAATAPALTVDNGWVFTGWDLDFSNVTSNITVTAQYGEDTDNDQMPDTWELQIIEASGGALSDIAAVNPTDDLDGDGHSNYSEYIAGMSPTNSASVFTIQTNLSSSTDFIMNWDSITGRVYNVLWTGSLTNEFNAITNGIAPPQNSYTDTVYSAAGFYKLEVDLK